MSSSMSIERGTSLSRLRGGTMTTSRTIRLATTLILLLLPSLARADSSPAPLQVYFGPKAADDPQGLHHNLLRFLDSAKTSIYGSVHEIDMITIAEKLA